RVGNGVESANRGCRSVSGVIVWPAVPLADPGLFLCVHSRDACLRVVRVSADGAELRGVDLGNPGPNLFRLLRGSLSKAMRPIVKVERISKRFRIQPREAHSVRYDTLRESLAKAVR